MPHLHLTRDQVELASP